ncbi:MAG: ribonuclease P protein component [Firmicutes bacterium]|nr:ribonuclease P protein component [Bacillota bacterium]
MKTVFLKKTSDFKRVYFKGRFKIDSCMVLYILKNRLGHPRVGIATSKKIGGAVQRNRARRIIKEAWRAIVRKKFGFDLIFVARSGIIKLKTKEVQREIFCLIKRFGIE